MPSILSCADSRIAPEYAFDSGRGDLFVCRVADNFANDDSVASYPADYNLDNVVAVAATDRYDNLANKFTNYDLYDWMWGVLAGVYGYFLQQATATARLAHRALGAVPRRTAQ